MSQLAELAGTIEVVPPDLSIEELLIATYPPSVLNQALTADTRALDGDESEIAHLTAVETIYRTQADSGSTFAAVIAEVAIATGDDDLPELAELLAANAERREEVAADAESSTFVASAELLAKRAAVELPIDPRTVEELQRKLGKAGASLLSALPGAVFGVLFDTMVTVTSGLSVPEAIACGGAVTVATTGVTILALRRTVSDQLAYRRAQSRVKAARLQAAETTQ